MYSNIGMYASYTSIMPIRLYMATAIQYVPVVPIHCHSPILSIAYSFPQPKYKVHQGNFKYLYTLPSNVVFWNIFCVLQYFETKLCKKCVKFFVPYKNKKNPIIHFMCDFFVNIQKYFVGHVTFYVLEFLKPRYFNFTHFLHTFDTATPGPF